MHLEEALNSKMDIKALIFDMDGLLFDSERIVQRSWEIAGNELGIQYMGEVIYHTLGMNRTGGMNISGNISGKIFRSKSLEN